MGRSAPKWRRAYILDNLIFWQNKEAKAKIPEIK